MPVKHHVILTRSRKYQIYNQQTMAEDKGFIKLYRKFFDHFTWNEDREYSKAEAWIWLLKEARYKDDENKDYIKGNLIEWERGQIPASIRFLKKAWGWKSNSKVQHFLDILKKEEMIRTDKGQGQYVITICNYDTYNPTENIEKTAKGQQEDTDKTVAGRNSKKVKKVKKDSSDLSSRDLERFMGFEPTQLMALESPLEKDQIKKLISEYGKDVVRDVLSAMENHKGLKKKYKSVYLTANNWCKKRIEGNPKLKNTGLGDNNIWRGAKI